MKEIIPIALLFNDIHFGKDNLQQAVANWEEALHICNDLNILDIYVGGDIFQSRNSQSLDVLLAVHKCISNTAKCFNLTIANGNHDKVDQEALEGYCDIFKNTHVNIVPDYKTVRYELFTLTIMSYFPEAGTFTQKLEEVIQKIDKESMNILYCHEGIMGGLTQIHNDELPTQIFDSFDKVYVGHYHDRKIITGTNIEYIGASRQHNFGEDEEKGYTILFNDGSTKFIKNKTNTRYATFEAEAKKFLLKDFLAFTNSLGDGYKVRVKLYGKTSDFCGVDKDGLIEAGAIKIEFIEHNEHTIQANQDFANRYDKTGIKEEYLNYCAIKKIKDIETGIHYLDKIH